jgi:hypothetical protein
VNVSPPTGHDSTRQEVYKLADALLCDGLSDGEVQRLERLLCADAEARRHYVSFMHLSAKLCRWNSANTAQAGGLGLREEVTGGGQAGVGCPTVNDDFPVEITAAGNAGPPDPSPSVLLHGVSFVNSAILSYAAFGLIMGAVVLATWTWGGGGQSLRVANDAPRVTPAVTEPGPIVGRITAMSDCRWADSGAAAKDGALIRAGRAYFVLSGSPEITFNTGAKVTLQGPACFEVSSADSGWLKSGSAIICVRNQAEGARQADYPAGPGKALTPTNPPPSAREIATHPLFSLGCPVGLLSIRGAEFSVATDELGALFVKVKRGRIALQMPGWGPDEAVAVQENCSAVTSIQPYRSGGFRWELYLMGDKPFLVDSTPERPKRPPVVFRGELRGNVGVEEPEVRPSHRSGS